MQYLPVAMQYLPVAMQYLPVVNRRGGLREHSRKPPRRFHCDAPENRPVIHFTNPQLYDTISN